MSVSGVAPGLAISSTAWTRRGPRRLGHRLDQRVGFGGDVGVDRVDGGQVGADHEGAHPVRLGAQLLGERRLAAFSSRSRAASGAAAATLASTRTSNRDQEIRPSADSATPASTNPAWALVRSRVLVVTYRA